MKYILIASIGNRDVQLAKDVPIDEDFKLKWETNNDDPDFLCINKNKFSFLEVSKELLKNPDAIRFASLPMIEAAIDELGQPPEQIVLVCSHQEPPDKQDSFYFGQVIRRALLEKGYTTVLQRDFSCKPTNFEGLFDHYFGLFEEFKGKKIVFENAGGTPEMRSASHFAGIFRNIDFVNIEARSKTVNKTNFKKQEGLILKHSVEKMLAVYDFQAIANLPVSIEIKDLCEQAINYYNLSDTDFPIGVSYKEKALVGIEKIINNLKACFIQGRYADVVGRIFRIEEAIGQFLFYLELESQSIIDNKGVYLRQRGEKKPKKIKFEHLIGQIRNINLIIQTYYSITETNSENTLFFKKELIGQDSPVNSGKNFYYFFFKAINKHADIYALFSRLNNGYNQNDNLLQNLRNKSIMGHGFMGVGKADIERIIGDFDDYVNSLVLIFEEISKRSFEDYFALSSSKILSLL